MPEIKGVPPASGVPSVSPSDNLTGTKGHPSSRDIVKASPDAIKSLSGDGFTEAQPSGGVNVKSGQGPI